MTGSVPGAAPYAAVTAAAPSSPEARAVLTAYFDLAEARQLYAARGYQEVAPFNDGRFADHWYGKILG